ncbi:MAG: polysaccharide deacetylase family protein, partial [Myxococcota bacterium]
MLLLLPVAFARPSATVALTFDDLPYQTRDRRPALEDPAERAAVTEAILAALGRTPAAVFVNCGWLADGEDLAERWGRAGHAVANHTAHHPSVDRAEDWATEVAACDLRLRGVPGFEPWFRYPYLRHGQTAEVRAAAGAALAASGLRNVPPTVPTSEWWLGAAYDRADAPTREALASAYVDHVVESIRLAQDHARARVGHDVPHVVLLHVNRLEADHLGALLSRFEAEDIAVVPVERALRDEVYARPDVYDGGGSVSWLFRLDPTGPPDPEPFGALEGALAQRFRPAHGLRWTWAVPIERQTAFSDEVARRVHALGIDLELEAVDGRLVAEVFSLPSEEELVRAALLGGSTLEWSVALDLPEALRVDDPARGLRVVPGAVSRRGGAEAVTSAAAVQGPADAIAALAESAPEGG